jgi:hypothetical protein
MTISDAAKGAKAVVFSGKDKDFLIWSAKFLAYCKIHKCKSILLTETGADVVPTTSEIEGITKENPDVTKILERQEANDKAILLLTMAIGNSDSLSYSAIHSSESAEYKDGNAKISWFNLKEMFKPKSSAKKHEVEQMFRKNALENEEDNPDIWFAELETLKLRMKMDYAVQWTDEVLISHILYNVKPKSYEVRLMILRRDLGDDPTRISLTRIKNELREQYGIIMAARSTRTTKTQSLALMGANSFKKKQVKTDCRLCGKKGHKAVDCWENPRNADKRPKTWKTKAKETAAISTDHKSKTCTHCGKKGHTID